MPFSNKDSTLGISVMKSTCIFILAFLFCASETFACEGAGTVIYFGNGMFNSMNDVQDSIVELKRLDVHSLETNPSRIQYKAALNLSETDLDNILSVINERVEGDLDYFWDALDGIIPMPEWLKVPIQKAILSEIHSDTLSTMLTQYENDIASAHKIVLVSHSQGNFYAEEAEKQLLLAYSTSLTHDFGFGNVRVATPTQTHFQYPYFTFADDFIINLVRMILSVPEANLFSGGAGPGPELDPHGHSFVDAYLASPDARAKISEAIVSEGNSMNYPCSTQ
jgi:hypothetical protein